ncbi:MAG: acyl-ACP--UDP-N-acetylglucosamine O-acyltransferase [Tepidisphaeraceae bacterium]|jgi:UDP-N-acetylglucosamine acyltransferase
MPYIHPTAIVDADSELADDVKIGAYCIIKGGVRIGPGTVVEEHSHIHGRAILGSGCRIGPAAYVGMAPQDTKYKGTPTWLIVGNEVIIRETASVHRSTDPGEDHATRIGDRCFIMASAHVGHNSVVENDVILANGVLLAGHTFIGERAFLGGGFTFHQFCRIGRLAVIAGNEALSQDVPPFAAVRYRHLKGYNAVGCRRAGLSAETLSAIRAVYRCFRVNRTMPNAIQAVREQVPQLPEVREILDFISTSKRGVVPTVSPQRLRTPTEDAAED